MQMKREGVGRFVQSNIIWFMFLEDHKDTGYKAMTEVELKDFRKAEAKRR